MLNNLSKKKKSLIIMNWLILIFIYWNANKKKFFYIYLNMDM